MIVEEIINSTIFVAQTTYYIYLSKEDRLNDRASIVTSDKAIFDLLKDKIKISSENKKMENQYIIIDLINNDYFKDMDGKIKCYDTYEEAEIICGMYELDNVWITKLVKFIKENNG